MVKSSMVVKVTAEMVFMDKKTETHSVFIDTKCPNKEEVASKWFKNYSKGIIKVKEVRNIVVDSYTDSQILLTET